MQLKRLFELINSASKDRFKSALVRALIESGGLAYGTETLRSLAFLAGIVRATDAIDQIRSILVGGLLVRLESRDREEYEDLVGDLVAVIAGFSSLPQAYSILEWLFYSDDYGVFAPQLFIGLCEGNPGRFTDYMPRLLDLILKYGDRYELELLFAQFVDKISLRQIAENLDKMPVRYRERLLQYLSFESWSPAEIRDAGLDRIALAASTWFSDDPRNHVLQLNAEERCATILKYLRSGAQKRLNVSSLHQTVRALLDTSSQLA